MSIETNVLIQPGAVYFRDHILPHSNHKPREDMMLYQKPSTSYLQLLEECGYDLRVVSARMSIRQAGPMAERGWQPDYEARDSRR